MSTPHLHLAKRKRTSSSLTMSKIGVDIRVPEDWAVESKFVKGKKCIGTHSGTFHCDEALACVMLKLLPEWSDAVIVRTRDEAELAKCEAVVDVGGVYDSASLRFDHHQKTFQDTLSEESFKTRLSSAGLVYRHFGRRILKVLVEDSGVPDKVVDEKLYGKVYKNFLEHIDAIDNGVDVSSGPLKYDVSSHLSARVSRLNPSWNEPEDPSGPGGPNARFKQAMSLTGGELCAYVRGLAMSWWPARSIVAESLARRKEEHPSGQIAVLRSYCPWKGHLLELEEEMGIAGELKFVLYSEGPDPDSKWRIQAVPQSEDSFALRLSLAKPWLGLRGEELSAKCGVEGCVFVHVNGFIGGNATGGGAMAMAAKSLEMAESMA
ncbi:unnamed protein product [Ascophyllum nodosum]